MLYTQLLFLEHGLVSSGIMLIERFKRSENGGLCQQRVSSGGQDPCPPVLNSIPSYFYNIYNETPEKREFCAMLFCINIPLLHCTSTCM